MDYLSWHLAFRLYSSSSRNLRSDYFCSRLSPDPKTPRWAHPLEFQDRELTSKSYISNENDISLEQGGPGIARCQALFLTTERDRAIFSTHKVFLSDRTESNVNQP